MGLGVALLGAAAVAVILYQRQKNLEVKRPRNSKEMSKLEESMAPGGEMDATLFLWIAQELKSPTCSLDDKLQMLTLLKSASHERDFQLQLRDNGVFDSLFEAAKEKNLVNSSKKRKKKKHTFISHQNKIESIGFIFANCAQNPDCHRYFFSSRFNLDPFVHTDPDSCLMILLNLSFTEFGARQCKEKLKAEEIVNKLASKSTNHVRIASVKRNLAVP